MVSTRLVAVVVMLVVMATAGAGRDLQDTLKVQQLRKSMLANYDKNTLPPTPAVVNLTQFAIRNLEMHEGTHRLSLHGWIGFTWQDERLTWKSEDYVGMQKLSLPGSEVWLPDLTLYNAGDAEAVLMETISRFHALVSPDGTVMQVPALSLHFTCVADLTYWPHDTHNCSMQIGSWVHSGSLIDIGLPDNISAMVEMEVTKHPESELDTMDWKILSIDMKREVKFYDCCSEPYVSVLVTLVVQRNAPAYSWIIKTPAVCLVLLTAVVFLLPSTAAEKVTFGGINIILNFMFLVFAHGTIRNAPTHTPLIVQLVTIQLVLDAGSIIVAALVVRASRGPYSCPPPPALHRLASTLAPTLCLAAYTKQASGQGRLASGTAKSDELELGGEGEGGRAGEQGATAGQWLLLGAVVDRVALFTYLAIGLIMLIRSCSVL